MVGSGRGTHARTDDDTTRIKSSNAQALTAELREWRARVKMYSAGTPSRAGAQPRAQKKASAKVMRSAAAQCACRAPRDRSATHSQRAMPHQVMRLQYKMASIHNALDESSDAVAQSVVRTGGGGAAVVGLPLTCHHALEVGCRSLCDFQPRGIDATRTGGLRWL